MSETKAESEPKRRMGHAGTIRMSFSPSNADSPLPGTGKDEQSILWAL